MAGCSVLGCCNRSEKGFIMKYFPKDPERRKEWIANMKRKNWTPTPNAVICEIHFAPEMWEKTRVDGKRKLKRIAIPTLFGLAETRSVKETPNASVSLPNEVDINISSASDHTYTNSTSKPCDSANDKRSVKAELKCRQCNTSKPCDSANDKRTINALELKCRQYNKQFKKFFTNYRMMQKKLRNCRRQLKAAMNVDENEKIMKPIFNEDQIQAMKRTSTKFMKWSTVTVQNALKLKSACGISGYKELLNQKYPLPSLRTLRRHQEKLKLESKRHSEV